MRSHPSTSPRLLPALLLLCVLPGALGCDAPCGPELWERCDVREPSCQSRIFEAVQCDRGRVTGGMPLVRVIDRDTLRAELEASSRDAEPQPHHDATLQLLDLAPDDATGLETSIDGLVAGGLAFYRRGERDITIVDRGAPMDLERDTSVLAHEMVHVIQDRLHGIAMLYEGAETTDERFALGALVEGDAAFHHLVYDARARGHDVRALDWDPFYEEWLQDSLDGVYGVTPRFHVAMSSLRYVLGARLVTTRWQAFPSTALDDLWNDPPRASLPLMFDVRGSTLPLAASQPVRCAPPPPPDGLEWIDDDSFGPIAVYAFLAPSPLTPEEAWLRARDVVGDRIVAFGDVSGDVTAFQWRIRATSAESAAGIEASMRDWAESAGVLVATGAEEVVFAGATDLGLLATWRDAVAPCE